MIYVVQAYNHDTRKWETIAGHPTYDRYDDAIRNAAIFKRKHSGLEVRIHQIKRKEEFPK